MMGKPRILSMTGRSSMKDPGSTWPLMPSSLPSGVLSRVLVKLGRLGGTLEGRLGGRPNLVSAGNYCPDHHLLPGDGWADGSTKMVSEKKIGGGVVGAGILRMEIGSGCR
jgi:hypothetical protein